jgi:hypothetical protein
MRKSVSFESNLVASCENVKLIYYGINVLKAKMGGKEKDCRATKLKTVYRIERVKNRQPRSLP